LLILVRLNAVKVNLLSLLIGFLRCPTITLFYTDMELKRKP
jgi:hypothetical protein